MRVLVTGAFGFVGSAVVQRLSLAGHDVVALTHRQDDAELPETAAKSIVYGDVLSPEEMARATADVDAVCHLAALTRVRESFERSDDYFAVNVDGTHNVFRAALLSARQRGAQLRFVQASTGAVYGIPEHQPIAEDAVPAPMSPYGESKLKADEYLLGADSGDVGIVVLRTFNIAGAVNGRADDDLSRIIPKALAVAAGRAEKLQVNGDGTAVRDFVHVADLAEAFAAAIGYATPGRREVLNVGATGATVAEIIATVETVTGQALPVEHLPPQPEPPQLLADTTLIRSRLGWQPKRSSLIDIVADGWNAQRS